MKIVDRGGGTPIVVVPGIQGRWEWMRPTIDALAQRSRVIAFSLADEPASHGRFDEARGFWCYVDQVRDALDEAGVQRAAICGVSYGGLIAAAFAARHPERTASLILVSALPPSWQPDRRARFYLRAPRLLTPLFVASSLRLYSEIAAANDGLVRGVAAALRHAGRVATHLFSPTRMARRLRQLPTRELLPEVVNLRVPTLIVTGEARLDRIVPVQATHEWARLWPHARLATLARSGHLGSITRPEAFANLVVPFAEQATPEAEARRRVG